MPYLQWQTARIAINKRVRVCDFILIFFSKGESFLGFIMSITPNLIIISAKEHFFSSTYIGVIESIMDIFNQNVLLLSEPHRKNFISQVSLRVPWALIDSVVGHWGKSKAL